MRPVTPDAWFRSPLELLSPPEFIPTSAVEPTAVPPTEQPAEPTAVEEAGETEPADTEALTNPAQQYAVDNPENYSLTFQADGTINIKAGCNNAMGSYTIDGSSITIELGPTTLAACLPDSLSE